MKSLYTLMLTACMALCLPALAQQQLKLPQPSPISSVTQEVGVSEIAIDYSSPAVKGRRV